GSIIIWAAIVRGGIVWTGIVWPSIIRTSIVRTAGARNIPVVWNAGAWVVVWLTRTILGAIFRLSWTRNYATIFRSVRLSRTIRLSVWLSGAILRAIGLTRTVSGSIRLSWTILSVRLCRTATGCRRIRAAARSGLQRFNLGRMSGANGPHRRRRWTCCAGASIRMICRSLVGNWLTCRDHWTAQCLLRRPILDCVRGPHVTLATRLNVPDPRGHDLGIGELPGV